MKQHPVPQHISSYQFRLVGDMTLKQFFEVGGGLFVAWVFYSLNIPSFLKIPGVFFSATLGAALAFLPFEERPLDQWIINFIKSINSPTRYIWKKSATLPAFFEYKRQTASSLFEKGIKKKSKITLQEYLKSLPSHEDTFQKKQKLRIDSINQLFTSIDSKMPTTIKKKKILTSISLPVATLKLKVRKLKTPDQIEIAKNTIYYQPKKQYQSKKRITIPKTKTLSFQKKVPSFSLGTLTAPTITPPPSSSQPTTKYKQKQKVIIPSTIPIKTKKKKERKPFLQSPKKPIVEKPKVLIEPAPPITPPLEVKSIFEDQKFKPLPKSSFSNQLSNILTPEMPNVIVGVATDIYNKILPNALVEIKNQSGQTVRALKSNKLGQFFNATPLTKGSYQISIEHNDYLFDTIKVELKDKILKPIKIQAKARKQAAPNWATNAFPA